MTAIALSAALLAAALLTSEIPAPEPTPGQAEVIAAADAFFAALRSDDKGALTRQMDPKGVIYVHDRMDPAAPKLVVPVADHLARWANGTRTVDEVMRYDYVLVDGDMSQVWGPYVFTVEGRVSHCGINSLSLVMSDGAWKVANTSFSMVPPDQCAALGAPEAPAP